MSTSASGGMLEAVRGLPDHFERGCALAGDVGRTLCGRVRRVVVCGMGGSAFPADLLRIYAEPRGLPLPVSRDYVVHERALGPDVLVVACSFSGDTEETIAAFHDARSRGAEVVAMSAGGQLQALAESEGVAFVRLEKPSPTFQPRAATGFMVGALAAVLDNAGLLSGARADIIDLGRRLAALDADALEGRAKALVEPLRGRIPVIYATEPYAGSAARIIKIKLNENAKTPAFWNALPELNHNEMVGYTRLPGPLTAVFLRDADAHPRMKRRVEASVETLRERDVPVVEVDLVEGPPLLKAFAATWLFDFVSCHLAMADGIDPNPVEMVEQFKARLA